MAVEKGTYVAKKGLAQMLKGGVIMDVVTPEQARIAEEAGASRREWPGGGGSRGWRRTC